MADSRLEAVLGAYCLYSPSCLEEILSETRIQDAEQIWLEGTSASTPSSSDTEVLTTVYGGIGQIFTAARATQHQKHYPLLVVVGENFLKAP